MGNVLRFLVLFWIVGAISCISVRWSYNDPNCDPYTEIECTDSTSHTTICLPLDLRCNGVSECKDGSDEIGCVVEPLEQRPQQPKPMECSTSEFRCDNKCYPNTWLCDDIRDCYDNTDERNCRAKPSSTTSTTTSTTTTTTPAPAYDSSRCNHGDFMCRNRERCFPNEWKCDGIIDCNDASDERYCNDITSTTTTTTTRAPPSLECPFMMSPCGSRDKCIYDRWRCDRIIDCTDGSDEENCPGRTRVFPFNNFLQSLGWNSRKK